LAAKALSKYALISSRRIILLTCRLHRSAEVLVAMSLALLVCSTLAAQDDSDKINANICSSPRFSLSQNHIVVETSPFHSLTRNRHFTHWPGFWRTNGASLCKRLVSSTVGWWRPALARRTSPQVHAFRGTNPPDISRWVTDTRGIGENRDVIL
jgi:hypothetical protein